LDVIELDVYTSIATLYLMQISTCCNITNYSLSISCENKVSYRWVTHLPYS